MLSLYALPIQTEFSPLSNVALFFTFSDVALFFLSAGVKEYCSSETFDISCEQNEAIMMQSAIYGRMQPGRCISGEFRFL